MSQTAVIFANSFFAAIPASCIPRPPAPISPMLTAEFAIDPRTCSGLTNSKPAAAAAPVSNSRLVDVAIVLPIILMVLHVAIDIDSRLQRADGGGAEPEASARRAHPRRSTQGINHSRRLLYRRNVS